MSATQAVVVPGHLLNLLDLEGGHFLEVGAYSRLGAY